MIDTTVLSEIQQHLLETPNGGASFDSGLWTSAEAINAIDGKQQQFLKDSLLLVTPAALITIPHVPRHSYPADWICTYDASYRTVDGVWNELAKSDGFEADNSSIHAWPVEPGPPLLYTDGEVTTLTIQVMPSPNDAGQIHILYVALSATLTGAGVAFTVPDEFVPAIKWGALGDLLEKVGRGADPERAQYCEQRYQEGVAAAGLMLSGWA